MNTLTNYLKKAAVPVLVLTMAASMGLAGCKKAESIESKVQETVSQEDIKVDEEQKQIEELEGFVKESRKEIIDLMIKICSYKSLIDDRLFVYKSINNDLNIKTLIIGHYEPGNFTDEQAEVFPYQAYNIRIIKDIEVDGASFYHMRQYMPVYDDGKNIEFIMQTNGSDNDKKSPSLDAHSTSNDFEIGAIYTMYLLGKFDYPSIDILSELNDYSENYVSGDGGPFPDRQKANRNLERQIINQIYSEAIGILYKELGKEYIEKGESYIKDVEQTSK